MSYQKTNWQNLPNTSSAVNKANLNKIETELKYLDDCNTLQVPTTEIPENADLNNYTTIGMFASPTGNVSATLSNCPVSNYAFKLKVEYLHRTDRILQTIYVNNLNFTIYVRYNNGSWGDWIKITRDKDLEQVQGILSSDKGTLGEGYRWCRRSGNVVTFFITITITSAITDGWTQALAVFPEGFHPTKYTLMTLAVGSQSSTTNNYQNVLAAVGTNGNLNGQWNLAVGDKIQLGGTFII